MDRAMKVVPIALALMVTQTAYAAPVQSDRAAIAHAVANPVRTEADRARDRYRHPTETLSFFGVRPDQTVVEFMPDGGWYTAILAPMLSAHGHYIGLVMQGPQAKASLAILLAKGGASYRGASGASVDAATGRSSVPDASVDTVLTFRNIHNLTMAGGSTAHGTFAAFYRMLKPGGVLGVVDHHLPETTSSTTENTSGYLKRSTIIRLARTAGFVPAGESAINANPKDTHAWPKGVWTLPPSLLLGAQDRQKYLAVGESDRLTLKFVKQK